MIVVAVAPTVLFPSLRRTPPRPPATADSAQVQASQDSAPAAARAPDQALFERPRTQTADTFWVTSHLYRFGFSSEGAQLVWVELLGHRSFVAGDTESRVQLVPAGRPLLAHRLVSGGDTASLAAWTFTPDVARLTVTDAPKIGRAHV